MFAFIKKLDRNSRSTLFTCFFIYMCSGIYTLIMGSVMPDLKAAYQLSDTFSGVLLSAHSAGRCFPYTPSPRFSPPSAADLYRIPYSRS